MKEEILKLVAVVLALVAVVLVLYHCAVNTTNLVAVLLPTL